MKNEGSWNPARLEYIFIWQTGDEKILWPVVTYTSPPTTHVAPPHRAASNKLSKVKSLGRDDAATYGIAFTVCKLRVVELTSQPTI